MDAEMRSARPPEGEPYRGFANVAIVFRVEGETPAAVDLRAAAFVAAIGRLVDLAGGVEFATETEAAGGYAEALRMRGVDVPPLPEEGI